MILKAKERGEIRADLDTTVLARNLMSVSTSMLNIGIGDKKICVLLFQICGCSSNNIIY